MLWVGQHRARKIHQVDPESGAILHTIEFEPLRHRRHLGRRASSGTAHGKATKASCAGSTRSRVRCSSSSTCHRASASRATSAAAGWGDDLRYQRSGPEARAGQHPLSPRGSGSPGRVLPFAKPWSVDQYPTRRMMRLEDSDMASRPALPESDGQFARRVLILAGIAALAALLWMLSEILLLVFASALLAVILRSVAALFSAHAGVRPN